MVELARDERGATSVTGLIVLLAVTIILASTVAVFAFGVDTEDVQDAVDDILDMDDDMDSLVPLVIVPRLGFRGGRKSNAESTGSSTRLRSFGR